MKSDYNPGQLTGPDSNGHIHGRDVYHMMSHKAVSRVSLPHVQERSKAFETQRGATRSGRFEDVVQGGGRAGAFDRTVIGKNAGVRGGRAPGGCFTASPRNLNAHEEVLVWCFRQSVPSQGILGCS